MFFYAVYIASPFVIPDSIFALANVSCIINVTVKNWKRSIAVELQW